MVQPLTHHESLELVDAPLTTPITLDEVKAQVRVEHTDDDALLTRLIGVAVAYTDVQGVLGRAMISQKWAQYVNYSHTAKVYLLIKPVQAVTAVKYYDTDGVLQTDTLTNYNVFGNGEGTYVEPADGFTWPTTQRRPDAIRIEYTVGYGDAPSDIPDSIRHALLMLVGHFYDNREGVSADKFETVPFGFDQLIGIERDNWYG